MNFYSVGGFEEIADKASFEFSRLYEQFETICKQSNDMQDITKLQSLGKLLHIKSDILCLDHTIDPVTLQKATLKLSKNSVRIITDEGQYVYFNLTKKNRLKSIMFYENTPANLKDDVTLNINFNGNANDFSLHYKNKEFKNLTRNVKELNASFVKGKLHSLNDQPAIVFKEESPYKQECVIEKVWMFRGVYHREANKPAYLYQPAYNQYESERKSEIYLYGNLVDKANISVFEQRVRISQDNLSYARQQKSSPQKQKFFKRKKKPIILPDQEEIIDRKLLFEELTDCVTLVKQQKSQLVNFLQTIDGLIEEEISELYGQRIYDNNNQEIIISQQLLEELELYDMNSIKKIWWDEYFVDMEQKIKSLDKSLDGVLNLLVEHANKPLGFLMANPNEPINFEELRLPDIREWTISDSFDLGTYLQTEQGEIVIVRKGEIQTQKMINYLTVEQTFQNSDIQSFIDKLQQDLLELKMFSQNVKENVEALKEHMQETRQEIKTAFLQHFQAEEKQSFFDKSLLNGY